MISITSIGPQTPDPGGERLYELRINKQLICRFKHYRKDGLAVCLEKAAKAAREAEFLEIVQGFDLMKGGL